MKRALASALVLVAIVAACSANIEDANACHYVARKACERLSSCTSAPPSCLEDLRGRCQELDSYRPTNAQLRSCGDAIANAPCSKDGISLPDECLDPPEIRYLWADPGDVVEAGAPPQDAGGDASADAPDAD